MSRPKCRPMLAAMATGTKHLRSTHNFSVFTHQRVLCFALHSLLHFAFSFLWAALVFELKRTWFTEKNSFECSHDDRWSVREQWIGNDCYYYYSDYVCGLKPLKSILFRRIADCDLEERNYSKETTARARTKICNTLLCVLFLAMTFNTLSQSTGFTWR